MGEQKSFPVLESSLCTYRPGFAVCTFSPSRSRLPPCNRRLHRYSARAGNAFELVRSVLLTRNAADNTRRVSSSGLRSWTQVYTSRGPALPCVHSPRAARCHRSATGYCTSTVPERITPYKCSTPSSCSGLLSKNLRLRSSHYRPNHLFPGSCPTITELPTSRGPLANHSLSRSGASYTGTV